MIRLKYNQQKTLRPGNATGKAAGDEDPRPEKSSQPDRTVSETAPVALVERDNELARLLRYWQEAQSGRGKVVLLAAEAGYGKSTLADTFLRRVETDAAPHKIARAACSAQSGRDEPFWPFVDVIGQLALSPTHKAAGDILDALLDMAPAWAMMIPVAGGVVGASLKAVGLVRKSTRTSDLPSPDKLLHEYVGALKKVTDKQPVLIFVDDVHWCDAGSVKLLSHLSRNIAAMRVLIVVAYRPSDIAVEGHPLHELIAELLRYDTETEIALPPLTEAGVATLISQLYPANKFPATLAGKLFNTTNGSPFFIVESLRLMVSSAQIVRDASDGQWMLVRDIVADDLPRSVEAVIRKRMERMPTELQAVLAQAAVQGAVFETAVLAHALDRDELAVMKLLEPAEKVHNIIEYVGDVEVHDDVTSRYRFTSSLIVRELAGTLRGKQSMLAHRKTAEGLDNLWREDSADLSPKLAMHYEKGKLWEKAAFYSMIAGRRARAAGEIVQAIAQFEHAQQQLSKAGRLTSDQQYELDENLSYLYEIDASYAKAESCLTHALAAGFDSLGWRRYALLQTRMAKLAATAGNFSQSLDMLLQLHDVIDNSTAEEQASPEALELHAQLCLALTHVDRPEEGARYAQDGLATLSPLAHTDETHHLYVHLNAALAEAREAQGEYTEVAGLLVKTLATAIALHDVETQAEVLVNLSEVHLVLGHYDKSREYTKGLYNLAAQTSNESLRVYAHMIAGRALVYQGQPFEALDQLEQAEEWMNHTRFYAIRLPLLTLRATALVELGSPGEAQAVLDSAKELAETGGSNEMLAFFHLCQALVDLSRKDAQAALQLAQQALDVFKAENAQFEQAIALRVIGRACIDLHQDDGAQHAFAASRAIFQAIGNEHLLNVTTRDTIFEKPIRYVETGIA